MIPSELEDVLSQDPEIVSGAICFKATRVPVSILLDYVNGGDSLECFLLGYPGVTREQALKVLAWQDKQAKTAMGLELAS